MTFLSRFALGELGLNRIEGFSDLLNAAILYHAASAPRRGRRAADSKCPQAPDSAVSY